MVALEQHHYQTARASWKAKYRAKRVWDRNHKHDGRATAWALILISLAVFWGSAAYGLHRLV